MNFYSLSKYLLAIFGMFKFSFFFTKSSCEKIDKSTQTIALVEENIDMGLADFPGIEEVPNSPPRRWYRFFF
jgi:hypothetical protein